MSEESTEHHGSVQRMQVFESVLNDHVGLTVLTSSGQEIQVLVDAISFKRLPGQVEGYHVSGTSCGKTFTCFVAASDSTGGSGGHAERVDIVYTLT